MSGHHMGYVAITEQLINYGQLDLSEYRPTLAIKNGKLILPPPLYIPNTNRKHTIETFCWWLGIISVLAPK